MGSLRGHHAQDIIDTYDELDDVHTHFERTCYQDQSWNPDETIATSPRRLRRSQPSEAFKCHNCKAFIGMPLTGGRHRNHCPNCLWSLHVDARTPGDRRSDCRSLMQPVGLMVRRNGEQALVHACRGCGVVRHCRVAADDHPLLVMRLPLGEYRQDEPQIAEAVPEIAEIA